MKNDPSASEVNSSFCNDGEYLLSVILSQIHEKATLYKMKSQKKTNLANLDSTWKTSVVELSFSLDLNPYTSLHAAHVYVRPQKICG